MTVAAGHEFAEDNSERIATLIFLTEPELKQYITIGLLSFFATTFGQFASATADGPDFYCVRDVKKNDVLNLREKPSAKSAVLVEIPPTACSIGRHPEQADSKGRIKNFEIGDVSAPNVEWPTWCRVSFESVDGWVACRFLEEDSAQKPAPFSTELWPGEGLPRFNARKTAVPVRRAPNRSSPVVMQWKPGNGKNITAESHRVVALKPQPMKFTKVKEIVARCFGEDLRFLSADAYYQKVKGNNLKISAKTNAWYLTKRAEGTHLVQVDRQVCEVSVQDLGQRIGEQSNDWWIKVQYSRDKSGWLLVGEDVVESGRSF